MRQQGVKAAIDDVCEIGQGDGVHCDPTSKPTPHQSSQPHLDGNPERLKLAETGQELFRSPPHCNGPKLLLLGISSSRPFKVLPSLTA